MTTFMVFGVLAMVLSVILVLQSLGGYGVEWREVKMRKVNRKTCFPAD